MSPVNENIRYMDEVCCGNWDVFLVALLYVHLSVVALLTTRDIAFTISIRKQFGKIKPLSMSELEFKVKCGSKALAMATLS